MCDAPSAKVHLASNQWFSVELTTANQNNVFGPLGCCGGKPSGFLHMNTWREADYDVSIPFTSGTGGFSCFKIPAMLRTHNGTFIAFAEARRNGCIGVRLAPHSQQNHRFSV